MIADIHFNSVPNHLDFACLLPLDWQEVLKAEGMRLTQISQTLGLYRDLELLGGGMVFSSLTATATDFEKSHADNLFKTLGNYIGFVWIRPDVRGLKLGTDWFLALFNRFPSSSFWLSIEEENLLPFYTQLGFKPYALHKKAGVFQEQILIYNSKNNI